TWLTGLTWTKARSQFGMGVRLEGRRACEAGSEQDERRVRDRAVRASRTNAYRWSDRERGHIPRTGADHSRQAVATHGNGVRFFEPFSPPFHLRSVATSCDRASGPRTGPCRARSPRHRVYENSRLQVL